VAITVDCLTKEIAVHQADLTLVTGSLYELDTEVVFRAAVNAFLASEEGIVCDDAIDHNTTYTVAGVTYARKIEVINGYNVTFTPNSAWSVRLDGSNNNLFDVESGVLNQNNVQVIPQNSAGLIQITSGSGLSAGQAAQLEQLWQDRGFDVSNPVTVDESAGTISVAGTIRTWVGSVIKTLTRTA